MLLNSLDSRGIRESHLRLMLQKVEISFKENVRLNTQCSKIGSIGETCVKNEADETDSSPDRHTGSDSPSSTLCGLNSDTSETSSSFKIELGKSESDKKSALRRYQDIQQRFCQNQDHWKKQMQQIANNGYVCDLARGVRICRHTSLLPCGKYKISTENVTFLNIVQMTEPEGYLDQCKDLELKSVFQQTGSVNQKLLYDFPQC